MKDPLLIAASSPSTNNQDIKWRRNKGKDSSVHITEYRSKINPTVKP